MKKPKLSEIKARYITTRSRQRGILTEDYFYLLDLVERMGKLAELVVQYSSGDFRDQDQLMQITVSMENEARALVEELKQ